MGLDVTLIVSVLSALVSLSVLANFVHTRQKEREETAAWRQTVNDQLERLEKRVDSHNRYAEMFREYGEDIAFIRGKLEGK